MNRRGLKAYVFYMGKDESDPGCTAVPADAKNSHLDLGKVDPGALLIAVLVVAVTPWTEDGSWEPINTITACVVLFVLLAFAWPAQRVRWRILVAVGSVFALVSGAALAWPLQDILKLEPDVASYSSLVLGLLITAGVFTSAVRSGKIRPTPG
ncbi:hypothetical protein ACKAE7_18110 [Pseudarthrobacter sp. NKDBFgelt]|uniref:SPW repeat-containing protein n=2 Tax=Micrococcaceae TaxID=1268 RepID=A0ABQ1Y340_9MICC|nr:hypothetical protein GCM10011577_38760 [Pseudarthrobacter polychromogenes]